MKKPALLHRLSALLGGVLFTTAVLAQNPIPIDLPQCVPGEIVKYLQPPDPSGCDVLNTFGTIQTPNGFGGIMLADDFLCTQSGPITDMHLWGSWLSDRKSDNASFCLTIFADAVDANGNRACRPAQMLWSTVFNPGEYTSKPVYTGNEVFWEPKLQQAMGQDTIIWQYDFCPKLPCLQKEGTYYWLGGTGAGPVSRGSLFRLEDHAGSKELSQRLRDQLGLLRGRRPVGPGHQARGNWRSQER